MKITVIHGQNHKGSTYNICKILLEKISVDKEITEFFLPKDLNHFCLGCYKCINGDENCPFYEEKVRIMQAIENSDLLIFTTPTYGLRCSAPMKSFIDLTFTYWMPHRPRQSMFSKQAVVISTAAGQGTKTAIKDISDMLFYWGVPKVSKYGISVQAMKWDEVSDKKINKINKAMTKLAKNISQNKRPRVGLKLRFIFFIMRAMQMGGMGSSEFEKQYWDKQGWLGKKRPWKK